MADGSDPFKPEHTTVAPTLPLVATAVAGTPLAVATVSLLNRTVFAEHPLTVEEAMAFGGIGAAVLGYVFHIAQVLVNRAIERV